MGTVGRGDLFIYQGDDFYARVRVVDGDGDDVDITSYTPKAQIRRKYAQDSDADDIVMTLSSVVQTPHVLLTLSREESMLLYGRYRWDLQLADETGYLTTVIAGAVSAFPEVTR